MNDPYEMTSYVIADATGKILVVGRVPKFMLDAQLVDSGHELVEGDADIATDYVSNKVVTPRLINPSTLTGTKLLNVPNPSSVTIAGGTATDVTDGEVDLSFTQPGTYKVTVSSWPALDAVFSVTQL